MSLSAATLLYNGMMICLVGVAVFGYWQRPGWPRFIGLLVALLAAGLLISVVMCLPVGRPLRAARLLCFGWFIHTAIYLVGVLLIGQTKGVRPACGTLLMLTLGVVIYAFLIEPFRLEVTHFHIVSPKVHRSLKLGVLADFQTDQFRDYERNALRLLMVERPDAIFLAGDYLQSETVEGWESLRNQTNEFLREIEFDAPMGVYAVGGNTDFRRWPEIFDGMGVTTFVGTDAVESEHFMVTGLAMEESFETQLTIPAEQKFHIVLGHSPDFSLSSTVEADLLIAGHTHGGQVRLPFIGPLITFSRIPRSWAVGMTDIGNGRRLVVSRGVGMERRDAPRLRFLCRPQLVVVHVDPVPKF